MTIKAASLPFAEGNPLRHHLKYALVATALLLPILGATVALVVNQHDASPAREHATAAPLTATTSSNPFGSLVHVAIAPPTSPTQSPRVTRSPLLEIDPALNGEMAQSDPMTVDEPAAEAQEQVGGDAAAAVDEGLPLPPPRPQLAGNSASEPARRTSQASRQRDVAAAPVQDNRGIIERFFNINPPSGQVLAYARPEDGGLMRDPVREANRMPMGASDGYTAVYDISARTVFMPNGEKLEAHSGLGDLLDDPSRVHVKNKGPTPPNVYDLSPREKLFHGVPALRMTPVGGANMYGRDGFLAHTYMLGPNGDSNGCISFKDYDRFLQAYRQGAVKRLIVVARRG